MEECFLLSKANLIRTDLLIIINKELSLQSPSQRIKINSKSFQEITSKFEKYLIVEQDFISSSPIKLVGNSFANTIDESPNNTISPELIPPANYHIRSKKITFSQLKLGLPKPDFNKSKSLALQPDNNTNLTREIRNIAKSLKNVHAKLKDPVLIKHKSELNLLAKKMRTETKKCLDRVYFSLNKKKEIVYTKKSKTNTIIKLHQCDMTTIHKERRKKNNDFNEKRRISEVHNINTQNHFDLNSSASD